MINFEFDRAKMRSRQAVYGAVLVACMIVFGLAFNCLAAPHWVGFLMLGLAFVVSPSWIDAAHWFGILGHGLRRKEPAITISQSGIIDNASDFMMGQLAWDDIEKMYPWEWNTRLLANWWTKMPIIAKQRGIVVFLKNGVDLQPWASGSRAVFKLTMKSFEERGRWLFIPEMLLTVTADEFMRRLNEFYAAQVGNQAALG